MIFEGNAYHKITYTEADNITYREADCDEGGILGCFDENEGREYSFPQNVETGLKIEKGFKSGFKLEKGVFQKGFKLRKQQFSTLHMSPPTSTASSSPSHVEVRPITDCITSCVATATRCVATTITIASCKSDVFEGKTGVSTQ